jgi:hypothetical protein
MERSYKYWKEYVVAKASKFDAAAASTAQAKISERWLVPTRLDLNNFSASDATRHANAPAIASLQTVCGILIPVQS